MFAGILSPWKGLLLYGPPGECNVCAYTASMAMIQSWELVKVAAVFSIIIITILTKLIKNTLLTVSTVGPENISIFGNNSSVKHQTTLKLISRQIKTQPKEASSSTCDLPNLH